MIKHNKSWSKISKQNIFLNLKNDVIVRSHFVRRLTQNSNKMFYQIIISMIGFDFGKK
jgi:hypothetical protein